MKVTGLDGKVYTWKLTNHVPPVNDERDRSELHLQVRELLHNLYPLDRILEEVPLPGSNSLTVDFCIPTRKLMVEAHGAQHFKFVPYFHQTIMGFWASKKRDLHKAQWAELNGFALVVLPYNEDANAWREHISRQQNVQFT